MILASASPRRRELLKRILPEFEVFKPNLDESSGTLPLSERARELAIRKASLVDRRDALVIGSDTIVDVDGRALGKPVDEADARSMLSQLAGREHAVITGVALMWPGGSHALCEVATVSFRRLTDAQINNYIASGEPMDKAGAYAIQGRAAAFAEVIEGDIDTVIGLPIRGLADALEQHGLARR